VESDSSGGAGAGQSGARLNLKELFGAAAAAYDRMAGLEAALGRETRQGAYVGPRGAYLGPTDATIEALQRLLDDDHPRVRGIQRSLELEIWRDLDRRLDALEARLDLLDGGSTPANRRRNFRLLQGGRS
jgi:hypothetical protein